MGLYVAGGLAAGGALGGLLSDSPGRSSLLQKSQRHLLFDLTQELTGSGFQGINVGSFVRKRSDPLQLAGFERATQLVENGLPDQTLRNLAIRSQIAGVPGYQATPEQQEQLFREAVEEPTLRSFRTNVQPLLAEQFAASSGLSGDFQRASVNAATEVGRGLAQGRSQFLNADQDRVFSSGENAADRVIPGLAVGEREALLPMNLALDVGGQRQATRERRKIDSSLRDLLSSSYAFNPESSFLPLLLSPTKA